MFLLPKDYLQIKKTKKKGRGVFAREHIPAGTIIGDYLGMVITDKDATDREKKIKGSCYSFEYEKEGISIYPVDIKAPGVHLINHSCGANCDVESYKGHNLYFAIRHIFPGEELTFDYNLDPESEGANSVCFCDSPFCRGTMNARVDRPGIKGTRNPSVGRKMKIDYPISRVGEILPKLDKYPKEIKDDKRFNMFANLKVTPLDVPGTVLPTVKEIRDRLRLTGRRLRFREMGLTVLAVIDDYLAVAK